MAGRNNGCSRASAITSGSETMTTAATAGAKPIVLAYSGGLDTSFLVPWLAETYQRPVITVTVDTGGIDAAAAQALRERALALGAVEHHQVDARADYYEQVLRFLIIGNVRRGQLYPLCVGAERVMQAQTIALMARKLGTNSIAHGCTAAGNDQVRFEVALRTLAPELEIIAPVRDRAFKRAEELEYLQARSLPVPPYGAAYSTNRGLWGVTIGGTETLTSKGSIPEGAWVLSKDAFDRPPSPQHHALRFEQGRPAALDGKVLTPVEIIERLEAMAAPFGIGRGIHLGDTIIGTKGRVAFEAPAAEVLLTAHRELEKLVLTPRQQRIKETLSLPYGDWVHEGQLLDPVCRDIEALFLASQQRVSGEVHLLFRAGSVFVEGVESPYSLMSASKGVYGESAGEWTSADALGFSKIVALTGMFHVRAGQQAERAGHAAKDAAGVRAP
jgi:argininosuccinate synthase